MNAVMTGECTKDQFWAEVEHIGWGTKTTDIDDIKKMLLERWDGEFMKSFQKLYDEFEGTLYTHVSQWAHTNDHFSDLGEDGYGDLISHVIGLGHQFFEEGMKDPRQVVERGRAYKFTEKFSYSLPDPPRGAGLTYEQALEKTRAENERLLGDEDSTEDHELFLRMEAYEVQLGDKCYQEPGYYAAWAARDLPDLLALEASEYGKLFKDLPHVLDALNLVANGDLSLVTPDMVARVTRLREERENLRRELIEKLQVLESRGWSVDNLVGDAVKHMGIAAAS
jgi:hypothetical protein